MSIRVGSRSANCRYQVMAKASASRIANAVLNLEQENSMDEKLYEIVKKLEDKGYIGSEGRLTNDPAFIELKELAGEPEPAPEPKKGKTK